MGTPRSCRGSTGAPPGVRDQTGCVWDRPEPSPHLIPARQEARDPDHMPPTGRTPGGLGLHRGQARCGVNLKGGSHGGRGRGVVVGTET